MNEQWLYSEMLWIWAKCYDLKQAGWTYYVSGDRVVIAKGDEGFDIGTVNALVAMSPSSFQKLCIDTIERERNSIHMADMESMKKSAREAGDNYANFLLYLGAEKAATMPSDLVMGEGYLRAKMLGFGEGDLFIHFLTGMNGRFASYRDANTPIGIAPGKSKRVLLTDLVEEDKK